MYMWLWEIPQLDQDCGVESLICFFFGGTMAGTNTLYTVTGFNMVYPHNPNMHCQSHSALTGSRLSKEKQKNNTCLFCSNAFVTTGLSQGTSYAIWQEPSGGELGAVTESSSKQYVTLTNVLIQWQCGRMIFLTHLFCFLLNIRKCDDRQLGSSICLNCLCFDRPPPVFLKLTRLCSRI